MSQIYCLIQDWGSVDVEKYHISTNGGPRKDLAETIRRGNYNMTMEQSPLLDVSKETWESSHNLFRDAFPGGFFWELLDLFSGNCHFTTRVSEIWFTTI